MKKQLEERLEIYLKGMEKDIERLKASKINNMIDTTVATVLEDVSKDLIDMLEGKI